MVSRPRNALTISANGIAPTLITDLHVCPPVIDESKSAKSMRKCKGIWDTGATGSVINQKVAEDLGIKAVGMTNVDTASGSTISPVYLVSFILPGKVVIQGLTAVQGTIRGADVLIGMDVITIGDFAITNLNGKTKMTFCLPSCHDVDYCKEIQTSKVAPKVSTE